MSNSLSIATTDTIQSSNTKRFLNTQLTELKQTSTDNLVEDHIVHTIWPNQFVTALKKTMHVSSLTLPTHIFV